MSAVYPLSATGAAADAVAKLGTTGRTTIADCTAKARFWLKGSGATAFFAAQSIPLPKVNQHAAVGDAQVVRLGRSDIMVLGTDGAVFNLRTAWEAAPQGYSSYREETWGWLRLTGAGAEATLRRQTAFDLLGGAFSTNAIAQTRFAHQDGVILRCDGGFDLFFDIASTVQVLGDLHAAAQRGART